LAKIIQNPNTFTDNEIEMKCIACFDLGEFARLYPGGASILDIYGVKDSLLFLIQHNNLELKNRALVCLQKIMMRSLKK
jgi:V-type H+-transporting ATPase subunit H